MSEYIERQALLDAIPTTEEDKQISLYGAIADFIIKVNTIPAADVTPVVHAYWIYQKPYDEYTWRPYICSSCKTHGGKHRTNYCQSCGAKMDLCPPKRDKNGGDTDG